jgi:hypothetical protein
MLATPELEKLVKDYAELHVNSSKFSAYLICAPAVSLKLYWVEQDWTKQECTSNRAVLL